MENYRPGWIKLFRSMSEWEWYDDEKSVKLFIHLMINVNYQEKKWRGQTVMPGELITSIDNLSKETNLSQKVVRVRLEQFQKTGEIGIQTTNKYTKITLTNWSKFQGSDEEEFLDATEMANKRQTNGNQMTNKGQQLKKERKIRKKRSSSAPVNGTGAPEFNSPENMSATQEIEIQTRWNKIVQIWSSTESSPILKQSYEKFKTLRTEHQQEVLQFVESLPDPKRKVLSTFWISTYLKSNMLHPGIIFRDLEKRLTFEKPQKGFATGDLHINKLDENGNRIKN
jgi:hypothetical protein